MKIGLPKEIKENEYRVAISPANTRRLIDLGHEVFVETNAGFAAGFSDEQYAQAGCKIVPDEKAVFKQAEFIVKVKEIMPEEFDYLDEKHTIFTYIHSANRLPQTEALLRSKVVAFAYEDVKDERGRFPLLEPMSRLAGEVGILTGIFYSFTTTDGLGKIVCGNPGIKPMKIIVFGAGNVGTAAARLAVKLNADVILMDTDIEKLDCAAAVTLPGVRTVFSNHDNIMRELKDADLVINAVKWFPGLKLITRDMLKEMQPNALIVDIDAEPDGAVETSQYTTHENPIFVIDGIRHMGIPNLPSSVANTASQALSNATIPYIEEIAEKGWKLAAMENPRLYHGLDFVNGYLTFKDTAEAFGIALTDKERILEI